MRIIAGKLKGSKLFISKNKNTRPLKDAVKENVFNLITHSKNISFELKKTSVLDLYSGTGSFGLECLSRETENVYFVENQKETFTILEKNIEKLKLKKKSKIFYKNVFELVESQNTSLPKFDLIFCDPPFKNTNVERLIKLIFNRKILKKDGIIIIHRHKKTKEIFPDFFNIVEERVYGLSKIIFGKLLY